MSVKEIQTAIIELPPEELANLLEWIEEYRSDEWGREISQEMRPTCCSAASFLKEGFGK